MHRWAIGAAMALSLVACNAGGESSLEDPVRAELDGLDAETNLYAKHLSTGDEIAIRADEPVNTLSIINVPCVCS